MTRVRIARLIVVLGMALVACEPSGSGDDGDDVLAGVDVDLHEALEIARAELPAGTPLEAELSLDDDPVYDVDVLLSGEVREVLVDAETGEVLGSLSEPDDLEEAIAVAAALASAEVSIDEAIDIAAEAGDGVAVAIDVDADSQLFQVVIIRDNDMIQVTVELATGEPSVDEMPPEDD